MPTVTAVLEYDGKQYTVTSDQWTEDEELESHVWYMWTQGNYSCDCNRLLFISYEHDDYPGEENEDGWFACGHKSTLISLTLDGKDLLASTVNERLWAAGLISLR